MKRKILVSLNAASLITLIYMLVSMSFAIDLLPQYSSLNHNAQVENINGSMDINELKNSCIKEANAIREISVERNEETKKSMLLLLFCIIVFSIDIYYLNKYIGNAQIKNKI